MSEASSLDKDVKVHLRFIIEPFEIELETIAKESDIGATIDRVVNNLQASQESLTSAISSLDLTKFKPIRSRLVLEPEDPMQRVAARLSADVGQLNKVFLVEKEKVFIKCRGEAFGTRGPGEKTVLAMLYVYKYALDKSPTHGEINDAYEKMKFRLGFGHSVKPHLLKAGKISEDKQTGTIAIEPHAIAEAEGVIRKILPKV